MTNEALGGIKHFEEVGPRIESLKEELKGREYFDPVGAVLYDALMKILDDAERLYELFLGTTKGQPEANRGYEFIVDEFVVTILDPATRKHAEDFFNYLAISDDKGFLPHSSISPGGDPNKWYFHNGYVGHPLLDEPSRKGELSDPENLVALFLQYQIKLKDRSKRYFPDHYDLARKLIVSSIVKYLRNSGQNINSKGVSVEEFFMNRVLELVVFLRRFDFRQKPVEDDPIFILEESKLTEFLTNFAEEFPELAAEFERLRRQVRINSRVLKVIGTHTFWKWGKCDPNAVKYHENLERIYAAYSYAKDAVARFKDEAQVQYYSDLIDRIEELVPALREETSKYELALKYPNADPATIHLDIIGIHDALTAAALERQTSIEEAESHIVEHAQLSGTESEEGIQDDWDHRLETGGEAQPVPSHDTIPVRSLQTEPVEG